MEDELVITEGLPELQQTCTENATEHVNGKKEPIA